jgi:hypothetical protein
MTKTVHISNSGVNRMRAVRATATPFDPETAKRNPKALCNEKAQIEKMIRSKVKRARPVAELGCQKSQSVIEKDWRPRPTTSQRSK